MIGYLNMSVDTGRDEARLNPYMEALVDAHPELLDVYRSAKGVCALPRGEVGRMFLCIGAHDGSDCDGNELAKVEPPVTYTTPSLTELKAAYGRTIGL